MKKRSVCMHVGRSDDRFEGGPAQAPFHGRWEALVARPSRKRRGEVQVHLTSVQVDKGW